MNSAKLIEVIMTVSNRGNGTVENPHREVIQYWDLEGEMLAEVDPIVCSLCGATYCTRLHK